MSYFLIATGLLTWGLICAIQDMRRKKINNLLTFGLLFMALSYILITGQTLTQSSTGQAMFALFLAIALSLPGYITGNMGAADVKMLSAIAIATNSHYVLICFIGAAVSIAIWTLSKPLWPKLPSGVHKAVPLMNPTTGKALPYAPFLFIGMLMATLSKALVTSA